MSHGWEGEAIIANPVNVAQADQIQAAQPRREPSRVILDEYIAPGTVYVVNLDLLSALPDPYDFLAVGGDPE